MNDHCNNLDAYLANDLVVGEAEAFTSHLLDCAACSDAVDEQRWIDGLLVANTTAPSEVPSHNLLTSVRTSIAHRERRNKSLAWIMAVAAAIVVALGWTVLNRQRTNSEPGGAVQLQTAIDSKSAENSIMQATFVAGSDSIAVPVTSRHPDVTVVRVFPTYRPQFDATAATASPNTADPQSWQRLSNGG